jgi:hypothetical protein
VNRTLAITLGPEPHQRERFLHGAAVLEQRGAGGLREQLAIQRAQRIPPRLLDEPEAERLAPAGEQLRRRLHDRGRKSEPPPPRQRAEQGAHRLAVVELPCAQREQELPVVEQRRCVRRERRALLGRRALHEVPCARHVLGLGERGGGRELLGQGRVEQRIARRQRQRHTQVVRRQSSTQREVLAIAPLELPDADVHWMPRERAAESMGPAAFG